MIRYRLSVHTDIDGLFAKLILSKVDRHLLASPEGCTSKPPAYLNKDCTEDPYCILTEDPDWCTVLEGTVANVFIRNVDEGQ